MSAKEIKSFQYKKFNCGVFKDFDWVRRYIPKIRWHNNKIRFNVIISFYFRNYVVWFQYHRMKKWKSYKPKYIRNVITQFIIN